MRGVKMKRYAGSLDEESFNRTKVGLSSVYQIMLSALLVAIAYYLGALVGLALLFPQAWYSAIWPPNAITLAVMLMTAVRRWWVYLLAIVPVHLIVVGSINTPYWRMFLQIGFNTLTAGLIAFFLRRFCKDNLRFDRRRPVLVYLATITGVLS